MTDKLIIPILGFILKTTRLVPDWSSIAFRWGYGGLPIGRQKPDVSDTCLLPTTSLETAATHPYDVTQKTQTRAPSGPD